MSGATAMVGLSVPQHAVPEGARQRLLHRIAEDDLHARRVVRQKARAQVLSFLRSARIPWAMAAALATTAAWLGIKNNALSGELRDESSQVANIASQFAQARRALDVLTSRAVQRVLLTAPRTLVEPTGHTFYLADSGSLVFYANNLKLPSAYKTYELWLIPTSGQPIPAGLFRPDAAGNASIVMPPLPEGVSAKAFGVTIEKAEGSDAPSAPIIISGATTSNAGE